MLLMKLETLANAKSDHSQVETFFNPIPTPHPGVIRSKGQMLRLESEGRDVTQASRLRVHGASSPRVSTRAKLPYSLAFQPIPTRAGGTHPELQTPISDLPTPCHSTAGNQFKPDQTGERGVTPGLFGFRVRIGIVFPCGREWETFKIEKHRL